MPLIKEDAPFSVVMMWLLGVFVFIGVVSFASADEYVQVYVPDGKKVVLVDVKAPKSCVTHRRWHFMPPTTDVVTVEPQCPEGQGYDETFGCVNYCTGELVVSPNICVDKPE